MGIVRLDDDSRIGQGHDEAVTSKMLKFLALSIPKAIGLSQPWGTLCCDLILSWSAFINDKGAHHAYSIHPVFNSPAGCVRRSGCRVWWWL